jgi:translation elongation factor EF-G
MAPERAVFLSLRADAHVLLTESSHLGVDIIARLLRNNVSGASLEVREVSIQLTSCSERGTFLSGMRWMPARAEPIRELAARMPNDFMIAVVAVRTRERQRVISNYSAENTRWL